jgi:hypothetical protein
VKDLYAGLSAMNLFHNAFQWITPFLLKYINHRILILAGGIVISGGTWISIYIQDMQLFMLV